MGSVLRAVIVYLLLLLIFRISGKRTLSNVTTFDFVLTLIISESIQQALVQDDNSLTNAVLLVLTLVGLNILLSAAKARWPRLERVTEGLPTLLYAEGKPQQEALKRERVDEQDIVHAARSSQGLEGMDDVEFAVLEASGGISVIPRKKRS